MRPRRFCRGKAPTDPPPGRPPTRCFNEAPAILPGKAEPPARTAPSRIRFNEAPAILPGKGETNRRRNEASARLQ